MKFPRSRFFYCQLRGGGGVERELAVQNKSFIWCLPGQSAALASPPTVVDEGVEDEEVKVPGRQKIGWRDEHEEEGQR